jgi:hypothetical protein
MWFVTGFAGEQPARGPREKPVNHNTQTGESHVVCDRFRRGAGGRAAPWRKRSATTLKPASLMWFVTGFVGEPATT